MAGGYCSFDWLGFYIKFRITFKALVVVKHACIIKSMPKNFVMFVCLIRIKYQIIFLDLAAGIKKRNIIW